MRSIDMPNSTVKVQVLDEPGAGGACHEYLLSASAGDSFEPILIKFQKSGVQEAGINGVTQEALLAVVLDRLTYFQHGPFPSNENLLALKHVEAAIKALDERTAKRVARGVEGKSVS